MLDLILFYSLLESELEVELELKIRDILSCINLNNYKNITLTHFRPKISDIFGKFGKF